MALADARTREVKPLSFIYEKERALPADVCAEAIRRFEASTDQQAPGRIGQAGEVMPQVKHSTDLRISGREDWRDIDRILAQQLVSTFNAFALEFPFFAANKFKASATTCSARCPGSTTTGTWTAGPASSARARWSRSGI
jgi:hypothetical protein